MLQLRPCTPLDRQALRRVCLDTSSMPVRTRTQRAFLYNMYCDYYAGEEASHCFAAEEEDGRLVGYILCAPDYHRYRSVFLKKYLPRILRECPAYFFASFGAILSQKTYAADYPAHLHIDLLEEYQRQGLGTRLMNTLLAHLRGLGVPGVMLGVGDSNEKGVSFYRKYGFQELKRMPGSILMGYRLQDTPKEKNGLPAGVDISRHQC